MKQRQLIQVLPSAAVTDGVGVKIQRSIVGYQHSAFDPFLMLDELLGDEAADYMGGFPEHPHRGFETVTYMLEGRMRHRDHMGNEGLLVDGSVQWMTAGRGVLHSEMPEQTEGRMHGFQLWVNLPPEDKLCDPSYQEFAPEQIPQLNFGTGSQIKVIAGGVTLNGEDVQGPVQGIATAPDFYDVQLAAGDELSLPIAAGKRLLVYVIGGALTTAGAAQTIPAQAMGLFADGDAITFSAAQETRFLVLAGYPIGAPVAQWGPFVMNTQAEIQQAIADYRSGRLVQSA